ncbi:hypothetical protein ATANTOWER_022580 [Ataeniobius toweri]|uniref:Uncharacterized protein n=1 Tax=Ataeniobius toweri TaxID=208326 RepID=A0ABU7B1R9_9TELE|nr:hypothetical protein [Ataeniobius toweri]
MTECEKILNRITEGDSDIDLSEEESEKRIADDEEQDEFDQDTEPEEVEEDTEPVFMPVLEERRSADDGTLMSRRDWSTRQDFQQYIDQKLIEDLSFFTNQRMVLDSGSSMNTTLEEIRINEALGELDAVLCNF